MPPKTTAKPAFKLMNATLPLFVLHLQSTDDAEFRDQVRSGVSQAPEFFQATPVVLSLAAIAESDYVPDWAGLCNFLRSLGMRPAGIMDASEAQRTAALEYGLAQFPDRVAHKTAEPEPDTAQTEVAADTLEVSAPAGAAPLGQAELPLDAVQAGAVSVATSDVAQPRSGSGRGTWPRETPDAVLQELTSRGRAPALVIDKPVRSGQCIHAEGTDLIVLAVVSVGAELIADGNIHVYAPLRGRALAGARGNAGARIFSQSMEAQLVSIAGHFKILEDVPAALKGRPAQVRLDGEKIVMQLLGDIRS